MDGNVAQHQVEHRLEESGVGGSIPPVPTSLVRHARRGAGGSPKPALPGSTPGCAAKIEEGVKRWM